MICKYIFSVEYVANTHFGLGFWFPEYPLCYLFFFSVFRGLMSLFFGPHNHIRLLDVSCSSCLWRRHFKTYILRWNGHFWNSYQTVCFFVDTVQLFIPTMSPFVTEVLLIIAVGSLLIFVNLWCVNVTLFITVPIIL